MDESPLRFYIPVPSSTKEKVIQAEEDVIMEDKETVKKRGRYLSLVEDEPDSQGKDQKKGSKKRKEKIIIEKESKRKKLKEKVTGFFKTGLFSKLQAGLQAAILLSLVPLLGLSGKILHQTSEEPVAIDNTTSSLTGFTEQVNGVINQVLGGNASNAALVELANRVIAMNNGLNDQVIDALNVTQYTIENIDAIQAVTLNEIERSQNRSHLLNELIEATIRTSDNIKNISATVSTLNNDAASTTAVINELLTVTNELSRLYNEASRLSSQLPISCKDIKTRLPNSATGYYIINNRTFYCDMDTLCGSGGGWTRLAYLDMSDSTQSCPSGFEEYPARNINIRACGRLGSGRSCSSVQFPSNGISYSQICGRVTGYQFGHPDATHIPTAQDRNKINTYYLDGVSITMGSPRKHVWSLFAGQSEKKSTDSNCPCNSGSRVTVQSIVGNDYFCESGNPTADIESIPYLSDPLWDGQGCGSLEVACCAAPGLPWFYREYSSATADYIELRACDNAPRTIEDVLVSFYEIFVQ